MPSSQARSQPIRVAVVADTTGAAGQIARSLRSYGCSVRTFSLTNGSAYDRVRELRPAVVLLRTSTRSFSLASAFARVAANGGPGLVLLTPACSDEAEELARDSGALIHVVEPVPSQALMAAVHLAAARAQDFRKLGRQLTEVRESIENRKVLARAKTVLMGRFALSEEEAHRALQRESRNRNRKLIETAWHVIRADARLSKHSRPTRKVTVA